MGNDAEESTNSPYKFQLKLKTRKAFKIFNSNVLIRLHANKMCKIKAHLR